jgi:hypothetical protein
MRFLTAGEGDRVDRMQTRICQSVQAPSVLGSRARASGTWLNKSHEYKYLPVLSPFNRRVLADGRTRRGILCSGMQCNGEARVFRFL